MNSVSASQRATYLLSVDSQFLQDLLVALFLTFMCVRVFTFKLIHRKYFKTSEIFIALKLETV